jgi:hypothetical protein
VVAVVVPVSVVPVSVAPVVPVVVPVDVVVAVEVAEVVVPSSHSTLVSAVSQSSSPQATRAMASTIGTIVINVLICSTPLFCSKQVIFNNYFKLLQKKYESFCTIYTHERIKTLYTIDLGGISN